MRLLPVLAVVAAAALFASLSCGPGGGKPDAGADAGPAEPYFGLVKLRCYEYVEGEQAKSVLDLGVVSFRTRPGDTYCPGAKLAGGQPLAEVHEVRYYQTGIPLTDYLYVDGDRLKRCRRDYGTFTGNTYKHKDEAFTLARRPVIDNDRIATTATTEVRDPQNSLIYEAPHAMTMDTLAAAGLKTPNGPVDATRIILKETVAGDGGAPDAPAPGTVVAEETRYFVADQGFVGLDIAVDDPKGTVKRYRLQGVRTLADENEALNYPCGGPRPDGG